MKWILFIVMVTILLILDLKVLNNKDHKQSLKEATLWSIFWVTISCVFGAVVFHFLGSDAGNQFFTAYVLEKSLSVDNLFVFFLIFNYFNTPQEIQHRCLFFGIVGAIVLRAVCIIGGVAIVNAFHPLIYALGLLLVYSGLKIYFVKEDDDNSIQENKVVKWFRRHFNVIDEYAGHNFFVVQEGITTATALFIVLLMIETSDIIFAADSIPAALAVSSNAFVLFTSSILAVLGLRAMFFVLVAVIDKFWALQHGIAVVLTFIGIKMLISGIYEVPTNVSLIVTLVLLSASVAISLGFPQTAEE
jgi:tellurite resistance protein TerC